MRTKHLIAVVLATAAVGVIAACSGGGAQQAPPPQQSAAPVSQGGAASGFGVKECDDYLNAVLACIDTKVPEAARAAMRQGIEQSKSGWQQAASTPQGKAGLATACQQARDAAKAAYAAYGCQL
jgi:hypothetical protein